jgi:site-specific recombinase XerD
MLQTTYATGLRVSEVCALKIADIDSQPDRMCLQVRQGKGEKDRYTLLSPTLLENLVTLQKLLGHNHLSTTSRYLHLVSAQWRPPATTNPLDLLAALPKPH